MSRSLRLTRRAEASLLEIARWTIRSFGLKQVELYETELLSRCQAILNGQAHSRSCAVLVDDAADLRFVRAGEHFVVFLDRPDKVIIVDILHSRSDLQRHVASLMALVNRPGFAGGFNFQIGWTLADPLQQPRQNGARAVSARSLFFMDLCAACRLQGLRLGQGSLILGRDTA